MAGRVRSATQINGRPVGRTLDLTNFSGYYISSKKSWLSIAVNQSTLALPVFRTGGVGKFYFPFFFSWKIKENQPSFLPNNINTTDPKETKKLSHILIWILKKLKEKKRLREFSAVLVSDQSSITRNILINQAILKTLCQNVCFDEI